MLLMLQNSGRFLPMHLLDAAKTPQKKRDFMGDVHYSSLI